MLDTGKEADPNDLTWAAALSRDGSLCATSLQNGKLQVWDIRADPATRIREYETKGSFAMCIDIVSDVFSSWFEVPFPNALTEQRWKIYSIRP